MEAAKLKTSETDSLEEEEGALEVDGGHGVKAEMLKTEKLK